MPNYFNFTKYSDLTELQIEVPVPIFILMKTFRYFYLQIDLHYYLK